MITLNQLQKLGYSIKTKLIDKTGGFDLDHPKNDYLVNLSKDGEASIIHPIKDNKISENFTEIKDFVNFHKKG